MLDLATAADATYPHVIRRIKKRHVGTLASHQAVEVAWIARVVAEQAMFAELPQIARLADRRTGKLRGVNHISRVGCIFLEIGNERINLRRLKAGERDVEVICNQQLRQDRQLAR